METDRTDTIDQATAPTVAALLAQARTAAGLSQRALAKRVGTSPSAISRLEDNRYDGHSMASLRRVASALGKEVVVSLVDPLVMEDRPRKQEHPLGDPNGIR